MRQRIGQVMSRAHRDIPQYHLTLTIDLDLALAALRDRNEDHPPSDRILPAAALLHATAGALSDVSGFNGHYLDGTYRPADDVHLGVAVAMRGGGLIVPVLRNADRLGLATVMRSLRNFFRSETLREALAVGRERWLALEDLVSFHVGDVEVFLRMDLAFRDRDGRVVIVDWKTGRAEGRFNEVQIAGYALYAAEQGWVDDPEQILTELNYLVIPRSRRRTVKAQQLDHARRFIARSAVDMKALLLDPLANLARLEDFPMIDRPRVCRRCNFRRLCFPRMEALELVSAAQSLGRATSS